MKFNSIIESAQYIFDKYKENVAIDHKGFEYTYGALKEEIDRFSDELRAQELNNKCKALVVMKDPITYIKMLFSLWTLDYIAIPFQGKVCTREIEDAVKASDCNLIIEDYGFNDDIILDESDVINSSVKSEVSYHKLNNRNSLSGEENTSIYFYTSGTTGLPKCVRFSTYALWRNVYDLMEEWKLESSDVVFTPLSPLLTATLTTAVLPALMAGGKLVLTNTALPGHILKTIKAKGVTVFFAVPYIYDLINASMGDRNNMDWTRVRVCSTSSARLNEKTYSEFYHATGKIMHSIYCSSEAGAITYNDSEDYDGGFPSVGRGFSGVEIKILSEQGNELPAGECGEIFVKGGHVSDGYYNREELEGEVYKDGLVKTSDLGYMDENGYLYITGRDSATINVSGHLVNPEEVEKLLVESPKIKDCVVYGHKSEGVGEVVAVKIVLEDPSKPFDDEEVYSILEGKISAHKIPRKVKVVEKLEYGRYGKKIRK